MPPGPKDLCGFLQEPLQAEEIEKCYGSISDNLLPSPRAFQVHFLKAAGYGEEWTLTPLRSILLNDPDVVGPAQKLLYGDRLQLAWMVASSVVQLRDTPWFPSRLTNNDLFLVRQENGIRFHDVFLVKSDTGSALNVNESGANAPAQAALKPSPSPVALGILLIELILGKTIEQLRPPQEDLNINTQDAGSHIAHLVSDYQMLIRLLGDVNTLAGPNYSLAVRSCIRCEIYDDGETDDKDSQHGDVFLGVLRLLERDVEIVMEGI